MSVALLLVGVRGSVCSSNCEMRILFTVVMKEEIKN
jgi:hypothetical protein